MRHFRFSLRTLLLVLMFIGTVMYLVTPREPWVLKHTWKAHDYSSGPIAFSPDGKLILTTSTDGCSLKSWSVETMSLVQEFKNEKHGAYWPSSLSFSRDGKCVVTGSMLRDPQVWDVGSGSQKFALVGHTLKGWYATYSNSDKDITTAGADETIRIWDASTGAQKRMIAHAPAAKFLQYSPNNKYLLTVDINGKAQILDISGTGESVIYKSSERMVGEVMWADDSQSVCVMRNDGTLVRVALESGQSKEVTLFSARQRYDYISVSPDRTRFVGAPSFSYMTKAYVQTVDKGVIVGTLDLAAHLGFSPEGNRIVTSYSDGVVQLWERVFSDERVPLIKRFSLWLMVVVALSAVVSYFLDRSQLRNAKEEPLFV